jgi:hypothetical protein
MYLEQGKPLRCLLVESLPYTDTAINKAVNDAIVVFSDGIKNDTLSYKINQDPVTGRSYNYLHPKILQADSTKIYSLTVTGRDKKITGKTTFSQKIITIDSLEFKKSMIQEDSFSVGMVISDPAETENYYRFLIGKSIYHFATNPTDFRINDQAFNGKPFSFFSEANFAKNDTVIIRLYSLRKDHYEYLESIGDARRSNFNPFSQPSRIKSNVTGGLGIFTSIRYSERKGIVR